MSDTITAALIAVAVSVASALAFIAYKHHRGFKKLARVLYSLILIATAVIVMWNIGILKGASTAEISTHVKLGEELALGKEIAAWQLPYALLVALLAVQLYILFLDVALPWILGGEQR